MPNFLYLTAYRHSQIVNTQYQHLKNIIYRVSSLVTADENRQPTFKPKSSILYNWYINYSRSSILHGYVQIIYNRWWRGVPTTTAAAAWSR